MVRLKIKRLNFIEAEKRKSGQEAAKRRMKSILLLLPLVLFFCLIQKYIYDTEKTAELYAKIEELDTYLDSDEALKKKEEQEKLQEKAALFARYRREKDEASARISKNPTLESNFLQQIESVMKEGTVIVWEEASPIIYADGILAFTVRTDQAAEAMGYVERLKREKLFADVDYHGFERKEDTVTSDIYYVFSVECEIGPYEEGGDGQ